MLRREVIKYLSVIPLIGFKKIPTQTFYSKFFPELGKALSLKIVDDVKSIYHEAIVPYHINFGRPVNFPTLSEIIVEYEFGYETYSCFNFTKDIVGIDRERFDLSVFFNETIIESDSWPQNSIARFELSYKGSSNKTYLLRLASLTVPNGDNHGRAI